MKILFTGGVPEWVKTELSALGHQSTVVAADAYVDEAKFCAGIKDFDIYVSGGLEKCTKAVIESANRLKAIIFLGVDYKVYIDADAAQKKNIPIFNMPGANARAVAELTFMLMLIAVRKGALMMADAGRQKWAAQTGFELQGKTLGLVGAGNIARQVADIGLGFGMKVLYWTPSGRKKNLKGQYEPLDAVLSRSDVISLHVPREAGTIIDAKALQKVQPHAVLVNTSPASLVDGKQLYDALKNGRLQAAVFDGFYVETDAAWKSEHARLFELGTEKFFITPHAGWRTVEVDNNMFTLALKYIREIGLK